MPVIKSAKKKLRKDKKRTKKNKIFLNSVKKAIKIAKKTHTEKSIKEATSFLDKAVKKNLVHKNKAARVKSQLSKLAKKTNTKTSTSKSKSSGKK